MAKKTYANIAESLTRKENKYLKMLDEAENDRDVTTAELMLERIAKQRESLIAENTQAAEMKNPSPVPMFDNGGPVPPEYAKRGMSYWSFLGPDANELTNSNLAMFRRMLGTQSLGNESYSSPSQRPLPVQNRAENAWNGAMDMPGYNPVPEHLRTNGETGAYFPQRLSLLDGMGGTQATPLNLIEGTPVAVGTPGGGKSGARKARPQIDTVTANSMGIVGNSTPTGDILTQAPTLATPGITSGGGGLNIKDLLGKIDLNKAGNNIMDAAGMTAPFMDNIAMGRYIDNVKGPVAPIYHEAPHMETSVNVQPQLMEARLAQGTVNKALDKGNVAGGVANANKVAAFAQSLGQRNHIMAGKENTERDLRNQSRAMRTRTSNANNDIRNRYLQEKNMFENQRENMKYLNKKNIFEDIAAINEQRLRKQEQEQMLQILKPLYNRFNLGDKYFSNLFG